MAARVAPADSTPVIPDGGHSNGYAIDAVRQHSKREQQNSLLLAAKWVACASPWILAAVLFENIGSTELWSKFWGVDFSGSGCAVKGDTEPYFCAISSMPAALFIVSFTLLGNLILSTPYLRVRLPPIAVGTFLVIGMSYMLADEGYYRAENIVEPRVSCASQSVEATCRGEFKMDPEGNLVRTPLGCTEAACRNHGNNEAWVEVDSYFDDVLQLNGGTVSGQCRESISKFAISIVTAVDKCDSQCNRLPAFCKQTCLDVLAMCGSLTVDYLERVAAEKGILQRYSGEAATHGIGRPTISPCLRDLFRDMSSRCVDVPDCGESAGTCAIEDFIGWRVQPITLPFVPPSSDDRDMALVNSGSRRTAFVLAGVAAIILGVALDILTAQDSVKDDQATRAWATERLRTSALRDFASTTDMFLMGLGSSVALVVFAIAVAAAFRQEVNPKAGDWRMVVVFLLLGASSMIAFGIAALLRGWRELLARRIHEKITGLLRPSFAAKVDQFLDNVSSPSAGMYFLLNTMFGDLVEVVTQVSAILGKAPKTDYQILLHHVIILLCSLVLGTVCVLLAVRRRDSFWCIVKMVVDSAADIIYLLMSFSSDLYGEDLSVSIGFIVPAFVLGFRSLTLIWSVFEIAQARVILEFVELHRGHAEYDKARWPPAALEHLADTVARQAPVRRRSWKLPAAVLLFYVGLIAVAVGVMRPPGDYLRDCAREVGGLAFYQPIAPQVVTANGLLSTPACDFSLVTEVDYSGLGISFLHPKFGSTLVAAGAKVTKLDLRGNHFTDFPDGLQDFIHLQEIDLRDNKISRMNLTRLPSNELRDPTDQNDHIDLRLEGNEIFDHIDISDQNPRLGTLPVGFSKWFREARTANLRSAGLSELTGSELPNMPNLVELDIRDNDVDGPFQNLYLKLEMRYAMPPNLRVLQASGNRPFEYDKKSLNPDGVYTRSHVETFIGGANIDWEAFAAREGNALSLSMYTYSYEFTLGMLKEFENVNLTLYDAERPANPFKRYSGVFDFRHSRCLRFRDNCRLAAVPAWFKEIAAVQDNAGSNAEISRVIFDEGAFHHSWSPEMSLVFAEALSVSPYVARFQTYGATMNGMIEASGENWEILKAALMTKFRHNRLSLLWIFGDPTALDDIHPDVKALCETMFYTLLIEPGFIFRQINIANSPGLTQLLVNWIDANIFSLRFTFSFGTTKVTMTNNNTTCAATESCPLLQIPAKLNGLSLTGYTAYISGWPGLYTIDWSHTHIVFDQFNWNMLANARRVTLFDVTTKDFGVLGEALGMSVQIGGSCAVSQNDFGYHLIHDDMLFIEFEELSFPRIGIRDKSDLSYTGFFHSGHHVGDYITGDFMIGLNAEAAWQPMGLVWGSSCYHSGMALSFEGYTISKAMPWYLRHLTVSLRHAPVTVGGLEPLLSGLNMDGVLTNTLELIGLSGPLAAEMMVLRQMGRLNPSAVAFDAQAVISPSNILTLVVDNSGDDRESIVDSVTLSLRDHGIFMFTRTLHLDDMDVSQAQGNAVLAALASRNHYLGSIDLSLRSSFVTDDFLSEVIRLMDEKRLCLASLALDVSWSRRETHAPQWTVAKMGELVGAMARQIYIDSRYDELNRWQKARRFHDPEFTWCWTVGVTVPLDREDAVIAAAQAGLPAGRERLAEEMVRHQHAPTMLEFARRDFIDRQVSWESPTDYTPEEYSDFSPFRKGIPGMYPFMVWPEPPKNAAR